ncbi:MAG: hypothetical protein JNL98_31255 [Bryobacterales bacterium]|nr:hypothetical protein [Bryobacterales bacterium]
MNKLLAVAAALGLAAMLSAAPRTAQPDKSQPAQTAAKHDAKQKKHHGTADATPNGTQVHKGSKTKNSPPAKPGN